MRTDRGVMGGLSAGVSRVKRQYFVLSVIEIKYLQFFFVLFSKGLLAFDFW